MGRRKVLAGLAGGAFAALSAGLVQAEPLATVKQAGVLRVGVYKDNRPWSWTEGGRLQGIDVDLAQAFADALGVRSDIVEFIAGDDMQDDFRNVIWRGGLLGFRKCDVMMHVPFDKTLQADSGEVAICAPYYREGFAAACANEQADCEVPPPQFKGKRLAAATGTIADSYLMGGFGGVLRTDVVHVNTGYDAASALGAGKADVAVATRAEVESALHDMNKPDIHRRKGPLQAIMSPGWDVGIAVRENSRTLGDAIEQVVGKMVADGSMARLFDKYGVSWQAALAA